MAGTDHGPESYGVATEPDRVAISVVVRFAIVLAFVSIVCMLLVGGFFFFLEKRTEATEAQPMPIETEQPRTAEQKLPPEPRLEIDPRASLARQRAEEDSVLTTYGWVDKPAGVVRIPIERAMALMVEREKTK